METGNRWAEEFHKAMAIHEPPTEMKTTAAPKAHQRSDDSFNGGMRGCTRGTTARIALATIPVVMPCRVDHPQVEKRPALSC